MISILLRVPDPIKPRARYALEALSTIWGIPVRFVGEQVDAQTVIYGPRKEGERCGLVLFCDAQAYETGGSYTTRAHNGTIVWAPAAASSPDHWDLVGSVFRLLTLQDEHGIPEKSRDHRGIFLTSCLSPERREVVAEPLVENHAAVLLEKLCAVYPRLKEVAVPLWPNGKKYALLMSHDTDAIALGSPKEMLYNLGKAIVRRNPLFLKMFRDGFSYLRRPGDDPFFGFPKWRLIETPRLRSCFYLFAKSKKLKFNLHDCRSSVTDKGVDWDSLRSMADQGWEFGFHAPIHAKDDVNALIWGKGFIEQQIGHPVQGLRHHYWALDWRRPSRTFRKQAEAGFRYDTSIAWRDSIGFRAGTCLPYRPFDLEADQVVDICEIPANLMDGHLRESGKPLQRQIADGVALVKKIKTRGGVAMLNWHTETACNDYQYRGSIPLLLCILDSVAEDSDAWMPTPWELARHWEQRRLSLAKASLSRTETCF